MTDYLLLTTIGWMDILLAAYQLELTLRVAADGKTLYSMAAYDQLSQLVWLSLATILKV